jgi:hypothetical protein
MPVIKQQDFIFEISIAQIAKTSFPPQDRLSYVLVAAPLPQHYKDCRAASVTTDVAILHTAYLLLCVIVNAIPTDDLGCFSCVCFVTVM